MRFERIRGCENVSLHSNTNCQMEAITILVITLVVVTTIFFDILFTFFI